MKKHLANLLISLITLLSPSIAQAADPYDNEYFKIEFYKDQQLIKDGEKLYDDRNNTIFHLKRFGHDFNLQMNPYPCSGHYNFYARLILKDSLHLFYIDNKTALNDTIRIDFSNFNTSTYINLPITYKGNLINSIIQRYIPFTDINPEGVYPSYGPQSMRFKRVNDYVYSCTVYISQGLFYHEKFGSTIFVMHSDLDGASSQVLYSQLIANHSSIKPYYNTGDIIDFHIIGRNNEILECRPKSYIVEIINDITTPVENQNPSDRPSITINNHLLTLDYEGELQEVQLISNHGQLETHKTTDIHTLQQGISIVRAVTHKGVYLSRVILK